MLSNLSERHVYNRIAMYSGSMEIILKEVRIDKCNEDQGKDHKEERKQRSDIIGRNRRGFRVGS